MFHTLKICRKYTLHQNDEILEEGWAAPDFHRRSADWSTAVHRTQAFAFLTGGHWRLLFLDGRACSCCCCIRLMKLVEVWCCSRLPSAFCWLIHCSSPDSGICYSHKLPQVDIDGCCFLMEGHAAAASDLWNLWKSAAAPPADFNHNSAAPPDFHRRSADWSTGRWHSLFSQLVAIMAQTLPTQT